jgi:molybdenum cofactor cytidylyltransferase
VLRPVSVVVPAAGQSSRMGSSKLLLELDGEPLLARAVRRASVVDPSPVVVLRPNDAPAREALARVDCRIAMNPTPERGPASSIACGVEAMRTAPPGEPEAGERAVLVLLPDMPFVDGRMLRALVRRYGELARRPEGLFYVTAGYGGVLAPPVLLPPGLLRALALGTATGTLRDHLRRAGARAEAVDLPLRALADVDTPDDRDRLLGG